MLPPPLGEGWGGGTRAGSWSARRSWRSGCLALLSATALALASGPARADLWGYVDDQGVAHLAPDQLDPRYQLFSRGSSFDTARDFAQPLETSPIEPLPATPELPAHLQTFFQSSPAFLSVRQHLMDAARAHHIELELLQALIVTESGFDTRAISPKGAVGLMQVMPATAERWGLRRTDRAPVAQQLTHPRTNVRIGSRYLRHLIDLFPGRLDLALAAYNAGEGAVQRAGNRIPAYRETQNYVRSVLQVYASLKPPPAPAESDSARPPPRRVRMELPGPTPALPLGGAIGRGNMPPATHAALPAPPDQKTD